MSFVANDLNLIHALVSFPLTGVWHADLRISPKQGALEETVALSDGMTVDFDGLTLSGTVVRSQVIDGLVHARVVGGAGKLGTVLTERYYKGSPTVRNIVADILRDAGEKTMAIESNSATLNSALASWHRVAEPAGEALSRILSAFGGNWRVKPDGTVLVVGAETWPISEPGFIIVPGSDPISGYFRVAWKDGTPPTVLPGITFQNQRIRYVVHELTPGGLRTDLRFLEPRSILERMAALVSKNDLYSRMLPAVVEKQNADLSIDVVVDNRYGITQVPIRHGVPGLVVKVTQGTRVLIGFENDKPNGVFAALWSGGVTRTPSYGVGAYGGGLLYGVNGAGSPSNVVEVIFDDGVKPVARVDDTTANGELYALTAVVAGVTVVVALFWRANALDLWTPVVFGTTPPTPVTPGTAVTGKITSGNLKLRA